MSEPTSSKSIKSPQAEINKFWAKFATKKPSKVTSIFPRLLYASLLPEYPDPRGAASSRNAAASYEAAAKECREKVGRIVRECNRTNEKFTDSDFDIEADFYRLRNCLAGLEYESESESESEPGSGSASNGAQRSRQRLSRSGITRDDRFSPRGCGLLAPQENRGVECGNCYQPGSIHRVEWIFEKPQFTIDGFSSSDIEQGSDGDCWWLAAVATIAHRKDLMDKVCVARDEECGVYGFVFYRDGEWVSTIVDDNLYLSEGDFVDWNGDVYDPTGEKARKWRQQNQTGSEAVYFGRCSDPNETWLPLMEKAYAKVHGDYDAIAGGWSGEAVEDMSGGVTTTLMTMRVLKKQALWKELSEDVGDFVFALSAIGQVSSKSGLAFGHAYSILDAQEVLDENGNLIRLVKIRNPWGKRNKWNGEGEWNGRWSDGSKEWTPYMMKKLNHKFGDDGTFWMLYEDMLETFKFLHRTRLFDEKWTVVQQWTSCDVSWITGYSLTKFIIDVKKPGKAVIVLSQLDQRYFKGLEGQYKFELHFLLKKQGSSSDDYLCRVRPAHEWEYRSVSCEFDLEPGRYEVLPKITATRNKDANPIGKLVEYFADKNPQKLRQVGMQYDLAHAKGGVPDEDQRVEDWKAERKRKEAQRKKEEKEKEEKAAENKGEAVEQQQAAEGDKEKLEKDPVVPPRSPSPTADLEGKTPVQGGEPDEFQDASENLNTESNEASLAKGTMETQKEGEDSPEKVEKRKEKKDDDGKDEEKEKKREKEKKKEKEKEKEAESESDTEDDEDEYTRWNAVCVVCLRVYSQDPALSIHLVKPGLAEETSSLVQGGEPAGATM